MIVAGLSHRSRVEEIFKGSVLNELTKKSGQIDVLIVGVIIKRVPWEKYLSYTGRLQTILDKFFNCSSHNCFWLGIRSWGEPLNIAMVLLLPVIAKQHLMGNKSWTIYGFGCGWAVRLLFNSSVFDL